MAEYNRDLVVLVVNYIRVHLDAHTEVQPSCDENCIRRLRGECHRAGIDLPEQYYQTLHIIDGFHENGLYWLAAETRETAPGSGVEIQGVIEDNVEYWCLLDDNQVVLGYDEGYAYAYNFMTSEYVRLIRSGNRVTRIYSSYPEMLADAADRAAIPIRDVVPAHFVFSRVR